MKNYDPHEPPNCSNCQFIVDIHFQKDITHVWTKNFSGDVFHYQLLYHPKIYVMADEIVTQYTSKADRSLDQIHRELQTLDGIIKIRQVLRYPTSSSEIYAPALELTLYSPKVMIELIEFLKTQRYNLFNYDVNKRQQFFIDTKSFPFGACHIVTSVPEIEELAFLNYSLPDNVVELDAIQMYDDPNDVDFELPPLRVISLELDIAKKGAFERDDDILRGVTVTQRTFLEDAEKPVKFKGHEMTILLDLINHIKKLDPDFLIIPYGDKFALNYLAYRASVHGITQSFYLGRLPIPHYPRKKQKPQIYMTYGQIMHKEPVTYLPGRIHLDYENSFLLYEAEIFGLITLCRLSATPAERTARASIGTVLTGIEYLVNTKTVPETLIPPNKAIGEIFKPSEMLLIADNGGLTYPAIPGVYDRVWAIDYTSLYPFIMAKHNIGNETVLCPHDDCKGKNIVPEVNYHVCTKRIGVVPRTLSLVLEKRVRLKAAKKVKTSKQALYKGVDAALKWILVCCFGYLGFKNARWGSIESHQCVTAYGRRYLLIARQICEKYGFEIIAGLTDSLFIRAKDKQNDTQEMINRIIYEISFETGIPMDLEGKFQWVVFCNVKDYYEVAALNRYFGYFDYDEFKLRGIKSRQRSVTVLETEFQKEVLEHLKPAKSVKEFKFLIPSAAKILYKWQRKLKEKQVDTRDLILSIQSHVGVENYQSRTQQALVAQTYMSEGNVIQPGQKIRYIVRDDRRRDTLRITIGPLVTKDSEYDAEWYCKLLEKAFLELTEAPQVQFYDRIKYSNTSVIKTLDEWFEPELFSG